MAAARAREPSRRRSASADSAAGRVRLVRDAPASTRSSRSFRVRAPLSPLARVRAARKLARRRRGRALPGGRRAPQAVRTGRPTRHRLRPLPCLPSERDQKVAARRVNRLACPPLGRARRRRRRAAALGRRDRPLSADRRSGAPERTSSARQLLPRRDDVAVLHRDAARRGARHGGSSLPLEPRPDVLDGASASPNRRRLLRRGERTA